MAVFSMTLLYVINDNIYCRLLISSSMGPCLGPMVGGWIGERAGWRWICTPLFSRTGGLNVDACDVDWVLFIFVGVCFVFSFFIPESLAHLLLRRKAEKLRKDTGDDSYVTEVELQRVPLTQTLKIALLRPLTMLVVEPVVIFMSICKS